MFGPRVTILDVSRVTDDTFTLGVAIGHEPPQSFSAYVHPVQRASSIQQELFFELSNLSLRRYGDCTRYHLEMCFLLTAVARGETVELPAELGATRFARPPSTWRRIRNHVRAIIRW